MKSSIKLVIILFLLTMVSAACQPVQGVQGSQSCSKVEVKQVNGKPDLGGCTMRIAVENAYQPFNYIDTTTGKAVGYDYDTFADICKRIDCNPEFIATSWDAMVAVMGGEGKFDTFDVGADGITITPERAQHVDFSHPYITSSQMLMVRKGENRFKTPEEFAADPKLKIGTQLGTTNYDAAKKLVGADRITAYDQFGTAVQALINGDVDAVMIDNVAGIGYVGVNKDKLELMGTVVQSEELGFIFSKGSPLVPVVDQALADMKTDGTLDKLFTKWFQKSE